MDASSPAGDGEKFDIIINMMSKLNDKLELIDCRVKELEVDDNSTIGIKSESSEKEKNDTKLMELGFLLPDYTGVYMYMTMIMYMTKIIVIITRESFFLHQ